MGCCSKGKGRSGGGRKRGKIQIDYIKYLTKDARRSGDKKLAKAL